ncbi:hypothetical protein LCGC14_2543690, partial [marine sediment metagenome]
MTGDSFIDAALIGAGANSFVSMLAVVYPGQPQLVDSMDITTFNNVTGEVTLSTAYKGVAAAIPAGVPYKIVTFRFVPAEVAALTALVNAIEAKLDLPGVDSALVATIAQVIGNKASTAIYAKDDVSDIIRYLKGLMDSQITASGVADLGSGVGLIRDAARTEIDDWWNGQTVLMLTGGAAFQKRPITDFLAASDDIIVAPDFDAAVAAGDIYVILAHYNMIVPRAADDVANALTSQVIGRKDDTALYAAAVNATLMRYVKGLITAGIAIQSTVNDGAPAAADFDTNLTEATDDHYNGMLLMFLDGPNAGQGHVINDYGGGAKNVSFSAEDIWTDVPVNGNSFVILPSIGNMAKAIYARLGAPAGASIAADLVTIAAYLDTEIAAIITSQGGMLFTMDFWSLPQEEVALTVAAGDKALPSVTVADLPGTATIVRAIAMFKFRMVENHTYAGVNSLDGAQ